MCNFLSAIVMKSGDLICDPEHTDSHEDLLESNGIQDNGMGGFVLVEFLSPEGRGDELLSQEVRAGSSLAEMRRPLRNDAVLQEIADKTRGQFYLGMEEALGLGESSKPPLTEALAPQDQESVLPGTPDRQFKELLSGWLLGLIAGVLSLEWLIRRLSKLA